MADTNSLMERIDAEFRSVEQKIKEFQTEKTQAFTERQQRLEQFVKLCDELQGVWRPRLDAFSQRFGDRVEVVPNITKNNRSVTFHLKSPLALFDLTLSAMTDVDVRHLILDYSLEILPILMRYEKNSQLELPLENVDHAAVAQWIDDRLIDAVKTYLQLHQNAHYLKGHLVRDPIANVEFPKYAAGATLEWEGQTYYFIAEDTRREFAAKNGIDA